MTVASRPVPAPDTGADPSPDLATADGRWAAVVQGDRAADGRFVYAVVTTGVYCRPSCPSRQAKRANVRFFDTPAAAEAAGFRACKRCRPQALEGQSRAAAAVAGACRAIEDALDAGDPAPLLADLAAGAGLSPFHFHRVFKEVTGVTPRVYGAARRAALMKAALAQPGVRVTDAIYAAGYGSNSRFYEGSTAELGMQPLAYRDGGRGTEIRFAVGQCSLGPILVAATDAGVCAIQFGDDPEALVEALQDRFPRARLVGGDGAFEALVAQVVGLVEAPGRPLDLPLDVWGTAFQRRVWQALRAIPPGQTVSYADVAARIGLPKATRAVAQACAANPAAVAIPCHRVVRRDGALSGYAWGVERKRVLLERERAEG